MRIRLEPLKTKMQNY